VSSVAFSPDSKLLASSGDGRTVRLWDPATRQAIGAPLPAATSPGGDVFGVAFSPDGKLLASGGADGTVRLWNPATRQAPLAPLPPVAGGVKGVAFSPDGKLLAAAAVTAPYGCGIRRPGSPLASSWLKPARGAT
jgi:WD40 repeat protein